MQFYEKLQILRKQTGMTQGMLAEKMGVSRQAISKWESGSAYPDIKKIGELCILFGTDADTLLDPKIEEIRLSKDPVEPFDPLILGANLKRIRAARGMGQEMLAELLGVSRQSISKWETGFSVPKTEILLTLLNALNTDFSELFYRENEENTEKASNRKHGEENIKDSFSVVTDTSKAKNRSAIPFKKDEKQDLPSPSFPKQTATRQKKHSFLIPFLALLGLSLILILSLLITLPLLLKKRNNDGANSPATAPAQTTQTTPPMEPQKEPPAAAKPWSGRSDVSWYNANESEFTLYTAEELAGLAVLVNSGIDSFEDKTIRLGTSIDLAGTPTLPWIPIGGGASLIPLDLDPEEVKELYGNRDLIEWNGENQTPASFRGTFLGQGNTVTGLWYNEEQHYVGLFGLIWGGSVKDLNVEVGQCNGSNQVGAICGALYSRPGYESSIVNCHVKVANLLSGETAVGGVVGEIRAYRQSVTVSQCSVTGGIGGHLNTGGILGFGESYGKDCTLTVTQCYFDARLYNYETDYLYNDSHILGKNFGGIAGLLQILEKSELLLSHCESTGELCSNVDTLNVGGIVGGLETLCDGSPMGDTSNGYAKISNCRNTGSICKNSKKTMCVGGIVGLAQPINIRISYCYNTGEITAQYECGGICGSYNCNGAEDGIRYCAFSGTILSTMEHIPEWMTKEPEWKYSYAQHSFGGIVGYVGSTVQAQTVISHCYVNGLIDAQFKGAILGVHTQTKGQIKDCIASLESAEQLYGLDEELSYEGCGVLYAKEVSDSIIYRDWIEWDLSHWNTDTTPPLLIR